MIVNNLTNWIWDTTDQLTKSVTLTTNVATTIYWGDGTSTEIALAVDNVTYEHTYTAAGYYTAGIKDNVATLLNVSNKKVTDIDLANATVLKELYCGDNQLTMLDITANTTIEKFCCVQPTLSILKLTQEQVASMNILNTLVSCNSVANGEIHKFLDTMINVNEVVCTEHIGGTTENGGKCTTCGVKYIGVKYYVKLDNGLVQTIFSSLPGKVIRVGFTDDLATVFTINSGNITLETVGNYRTFIMPADNVDITIRKQ